MEDCAVILYVRIVVIIVAVIIADDLFLLMRRSRDSSDLAVVVYLHYDNALAGSGAYPYG